MKSFLAAFSVESYKLRRSYVLWATLLFIMFVTSLRSVEPDWTSYLGEVTFLFASVFGIMAFGVVMSWVFGREYADRTFKDLLALPVSRSKIVMAKYMSVVLWCLIITLISFGFAIVLGLIVGIPGFSAAIAQHYFILFMLLAVFHLLSCAPIAFLASISRGYLVPIAFAFTTLMVALTVGPTSFGAYLPWSIPALHLKMSDSVVFPLDGISYVILLLIGCIGLISTLVWWRSADQK
ncbi:ABC transporter permease [Paenibacillus donghaensis]|uniref:Bacitracin ABC transporter permease n=1 Tax=Paenibacillus donghaensis TaxID=414771 RepID=A0A2Z2KKY4_9BACL|nr:ABC transporter permease [Paenibacillus donghaensis]ASA21682.1 bacitracin ABC transporter permease [Paenibacillus donghaensis]